MCFLLKRKLITSIFARFAKFNINECVLVIFVVHSFLVFFIYTKFIFFIHLYLLYFFPVLYAVIYYAIYFCCLIYSSRFNICLLLFI